MYRGAEIALCHPAPDISFGTLSVSVLAMSHLSALLALLTTSSSIGSAASFLFAPFTPYRDASTEITRRSLAPNLEKHDNDVSRNNVYSTTDRRRCSTGFLAATATATDKSPEYLQNKEALKKVRPLDMLFHLSFARPTRQLFMYPFSCIPPPVVPARIPTSMPNVAVSTKSVGRAWDLMILLLCNRYVHTQRNGSP